MNVISRKIEALFSLRPAQFLKFVVLTDLAVIAVALVAGLLRGDLLKEFGEHSVPTLLSFLQLLLTAMICWRTFKISGEVTKEGSLIWGLFAAGFAFLALDEVLKIHERIDVWVHYLFALQNTLLSSRLDDAIIGVYMLAGLAVMAFSWRDLRPYLRHWPLFAWGFALAVVMIAADSVQGYYEPLVDYERGDPLGDFVVRLAVLEDSCKLIAEGLFLSAYFHCHGFAVNRYAAVAPAR